MSEEKVEKIVKENLQLSDVYDALIELTKQVADMTKELKKMRTAGKF